MTQDRILETDSWRMEDQLEGRCYELGEEWGARAGGNGATRPGERTHGGWRHMMVGKAERVRGWTGFQLGKWRKQSRHLMTRAGQEESHVLGVMEQDDRFGCSESACDFRVEIFSWSWEWGVVRQGISADLRAILQRQEEKPGTVSQMLRKEPQESGQHNQMWRRLKDTKRELTTPFSKRQETTLTEVAQWVLGTIKKQGCHADSSSKIYCRGSGL